MAAHWTPIFTGVEAEPYHSAVDAILGDLDRHVLNGFDFGRALLHAYVAKAWSSEEHRARAEECVDREIERLQDAALPEFLYGGAAGVGWLAAHTDILLYGDSAHSYGEVDDILLSTCRSRRPKVYDLTSGWTGIGVYFLERLPDACAREGLEIILSILTESAERNADGWTWQTMRSMLARTRRGRSSSGYYNVGVPHGVPGITSLAAQVFRTGLFRWAAAELANESARWVLQQQLPGGGFPGWVNADEVPRRERLAWCYGELGVAVALLLAARALEDVELEGRAMDIALRSTTRREGAGIRDAGLCHGAAGSGHLYNRLFQATGHTAFLEAARYWFSQALQMRVPGEGLGGYLRCRPAGSDQLGSVRSWVDPTFLTGATGTALGFVAATSSIEPGWDGLLLCRLDAVGDIGVAPASERV